MPTRPESLVTAASAGSSGTGTAAGCVRPPRVDQRRIVLRLLDGFDLACDGEIITVPLASQRLIAFLALHDRPLLRLFVAGSLWLDVDQERSCANLRSTLWRLRGPGQQVVEATVTHVSLGRTVIVDVHELVRAARRVLEGTEGVAEALIDEQQLEGDLLPDWYEEWLEPEREQVRQLRLHAVEAAAERALAAGRRLRTPSTSRLEPSAESRSAKACMRS